MASVASLTSVASPRRQKTAEEKAIDAAKKAEYETTVHSLLKNKQLPAYLTLLVQAMNALVALNSRLVKEKEKIRAEKKTSGSPRLIFDLDLVDEAGQKQKIQVVIDKSQVKAGFDSVAGHIKRMSRVVALAKKRERKALTPVSFGGVYTPVLAGPALRYFFGEGSQPRFGQVYPGLVAGLQAKAQVENWAGSRMYLNQRVLAALTAAEATGADLSSVLLYPREGKVMRNTITVLMFLYAFVNDIQDGANGQIIHPDAHWKASFSGSIPAQYQYDLASLAGERPTARKVPNASGRNTYAVVADSVAAAGQRKAKVAAETFSTESMRSQWYQSYASVNYTSLSALALADKAVLTSDDARSGMLTTEALVSQVSKDYRSTQPAEDKRKAKRALSRSAKPAKARQSKNDKLRMAGALAGAL